LPVCCFIDTAKEQCLLKHSLSFFRGTGGEKGEGKNGTRAGCFRVTTAAAAAEIERFQIKAMEYLKKKKKKKKKIR
jgi:hypothetical protein